MIEKVVELVRFEIAVTAVISGLAHNTNDVQGGQ